MHDFVETNGHTQVLIPLRVMPFAHKAVPTLTGSAFSYEAGTVLYGHYNMEYLLPGGDRLRLIANHNKKTVQLMLFTHNPEILKQLPGDRPSSLVANAMSKLNQYRIRSNSYSKPLTLQQKEKIKLAQECLNSLELLLSKERQLDCQDHRGHEKLRRKVISIIEHCRDGNRLLANNPVVSEGSLGYYLYEAHKTAQHYQYNRVKAVSAQDQMDFNDSSTHNGKSTPCFIWDSEVHIGHNSRSLDDAIRSICESYKLNPADDLDNIPANRFEQLETFFHRLWRDGQDWVDYLSIQTKPTHKSEIHNRRDGITITKITPYYKLKGFPQKSYNKLEDLVFHLSESSIEGINSTSIKEAKKLLSQLPNGHWVNIANKNSVILRIQNKLVKLRYFINNGQFYPLPDGQDLYTLSQISKRHLYLPERFSLRFNAFISRIPTFFQNFYKSLRQFIVHDLHEDFVHHIHTNHAKPNAARLTLTPNKPKSSLHEALENHGLLSNGETLEQFIEEHILNSPFIIARANHPPSPPAYENPLHRTLSVLRHVAGFFVDTSERNPIIGTLATAAYFYGAGAVLAPEVLETVLTKLHLSGLISGIEPVQNLARWMSHGQISEAISGSVTLWQGVVAGGNLDKFFVEAVSILKEDPGEIAIIAALALSLGYGITKVIPSLQHEMGEFPLPNYAALGGKGGAAIYDTIMHPGDDWLLGTCKWLCKGVLTIGKLIIAPFVEYYYYGLKDGFVGGWKKSASLLLRLGKQSLAASGDLLLTLLTLPLLEISAMLIHVPFRGVTNLLSKVLGAFGNWGAIGEVLVQYGRRPSTTNFLSEFKFSPLYGFSSPLGHFSDNKFFNFSINTIRVIFVPPLQLIKNVLILPVIDVLSLTIRLGLTVINPLSRIIAYGIGTVLTVAGKVWDESIGVLFSESAKGITLLANWIDNQAGTIKQSLLSSIEVNRGELYHWAFSEEDARLHKTDTDKEYYSSHPGRCEKIPHSDSHCLMHTLLNERATKLHPVKPRNQYKELFRPSTPAVELELQSVPMLN